ncbi:uncharacterized protein BDV17DRAFT_262488 [Aspergillus undulatus]|uniref:uncharacterized protein n=1 Tax=Aspergillus undulatus TaxID=1810928 RepID=UPI003CCD8907
MFSLSGPALGITVCAGLEMEPVGDFGAWGHTYSLAPRNFECQHSSPTRSKNSQVDRSGELSGSVRAARHSNAHY